MTPDEIVLNLKTIMDMNTQIKSLLDSRVTDELAICIKYNVTACNSEREISAKSYQAKIDSLRNQISDIQSSIDVSLKG